MAACFPGHVERAYPRWTLAGGRDLRAGCAIADAFVRTSGKEGIGVTKRQWLGYIAVAAFTTWLTQWLDDLVEERLGDRAA